MRQRRLDKSSGGFRNWKFMSVHFWGENPEGKWTFRMKDGCTQPSSEPTTLGEHTLVLYGTEEEPEISKITEPRQHDLGSRSVSSADEPPQTEENHLSLKEVSDWSDLIGGTITVRDQLWG